MIKVVISLLLPAIAITSAINSLARADELVIPITKQAEDVKGIMPVPRQGESMTIVRTRWGQEISRSETVGEPPITTLEYSDFFVYFENEAVIHTVIKYQ
jgi:hypothetical protein